MNPRPLAWSALVAAILFTSAACEKAGSKASGSLSGDEMSLLKQIPGDNVAVFGGNYMKMQDFMQSSFGQGVEQLAKQGAQQHGSELEGDMHAYMTCFAGLKTLRMVGGMSMSTALVMRMAMGGVTLKQIQDCAEKGKQTTTLDPDGKFLSIQAYKPGGTMPSTLGYLALPTGAITMRVSMALPGLGGQPTMEVASRADLEADAASAAKHSAADDTALMAQLGALDRSKTVWFAGNGKATRLGGKLGELSGTMDLSSGLAIDASIQLTDPDLVGKVDQGMSQMKQMKDKLPEDYRSIIDTIKYDKSGDRLHFAAAISDAQLGKLMKQLTSFAAMAQH